MKITPTHGNYFYFSLEPEDYKKHSNDNCHRFMNRFKKEFSGGKGGERYWLNAMKCWAIKNECRKRFNALLQEYFKITKQESIL